MEGQYKIDFPSQQETPEQKLLREQEHNLDSSQKEWITRIDGIKNKTEKWQAVFKIILDEIGLSRNYEDTARMSAQMINRTFAPIFGVEKIANDVEIKRGKDLAGRFIYRFSIIPPQLGEKDDTSYDEKEFEGRRAA